MIIFLFLFILFIFPFCSKSHILYTSNGNKISSTTRISGKLYVYYDINLYQKEDNYLSGHTEMVETVLPTINLVKVSADALGAQYAIDALELTKTTLNDKINSVQTDFKYTTSALNAIFLNSWFKSNNLPNSIANSGINFILSNFNERKLYINSLISSGSNFWEWNAASDTFSSLSSHSKKIPKVAHCSFNNAALVLYSVPSGNDIFHVPGTYLQSFEYSSLTWRDVRVQGITVDYGIKNYVDEYFYSSSPACDANSNSMVVQAKLPLATLIMFEINSPWSQVTRYNTIASDFQSSDRFLHFLHGILTLGRANDISYCTLNFEGRFVDCKTKSIEFSNTLTNIHASIQLGDRAYIIFKNSGSFSLHELNINYTFSPNLVMAYNIRNMTLPSDEEVIPSTLSFASFYGRSFLSVATNTEPQTLQFTYIDTYNDDQCSEYEFGSCLQCNGLYYLTEGSCKVCKCSGGSCTEIGCD